MNSMHMVSFSFYSITAAGANRPLINIIIIIINDEDGKTEVLLGHSV